jgi:hypothetical protein
MGGIHIVDLNVAVPPEVSEEPAETEALRAGIIQGPQKGALAHAGARHLALREM